MSVEPALAPVWLAAARDPQISGELELVYAHVAREIERRGPSCWASGRCCNFEKTGHRLYVTGLEAAYTVAHLAAAREPPEAVSARAIEAARAAGGCPFQSANLCAAHAVKPLGCRVYFCDRSAQDWQRSLSEAALADIRGIHDAHDIPYRYGEWREMLATVVRTEL